MNSKKSREIATVSLCVLVGLLPLALGGYHLVGKHQWAQARMAEIEPRHARMLGLIEQERDIEALLIQVQQAKAQYIYPSTQDAAQAGNAAQQRIREIFGAAGLQIISSQVLPAKAEKGFDRIPLSVRAEGDLLALQSALAVISSQLPLILINEIDVQSTALQNPNPAVVPRLSLQFSLGILREQK